MEKPTADHLTPQSNLAEITQTFVMNRLLRNDGWDYLKDHHLPSQRT